MELTRKQGRDSSEAVQGLLAQALANQPLQAAPCLYQLPLYALQRTDRTGSTKICSKC